MKLNMSHKKIVYIVMMFLFIIIFLLSTWMLIRKLYKYHVDQQNYQYIREQVLSKQTNQINQPNVKSLVESKSFLPSNNNTSVPYEISFGNEDELNKNIFVEYYDLKQLNPELVGWIHIPGFKKNIDYPIMQSSDNKYYLDHDFFRNESQAGSIFMDFRNHPEQVDQHVVIYGHAMRDMSMFGNLMDFPSDKQKYQKHKRIFIDFMNTRLEYEVFSTYYENANFNYRQMFFNNDLEYYDYINILKSKSVYDYQIELTGQDKIITISTCNNLSTDDERTIIHARLIRKKVYAYNESDEVASEQQKDAKNVVSANVYLNHLELNYTFKGKSKIASLDPKFHSQMKEYHAKLPFNTEIVKIIIDKADEQAKLDITINGQQSGPDDIKLQPGVNEIKIKVTSRDLTYARTTTIYALLDENAN